MHLALTGRHRLTGRGDELRTSAQRVVDDCLAGVVDDCVAVSCAPLDPDQLAQLGTILARLVPTPDTH